MTTTDAPAATSHQTTYTTPTDRELVVTRTFDAPRSLVWTVFTDPRDIPNWQTGPQGFTMPVCEIDLRPGGSWRYVWRNPHGQEFGAAGTYKEVDPPNRIVVTTKTPTGEEQTQTTTFAEANGRTTVTMTMLFENQASRDQGMKYAKMGWDGSHALLDKYLASLR